MKINKTAIATLTMASTLMAAAASAATAPAPTATASEVPAATSAADATPSKAMQILNRMDVTFLSVYYGSALSDLGNSRLPDENGVISEGNDSQLIENALTAFYRINDNGVYAGIGAPFLYTPVRGVGFEMAAPYLRAGNKKLVNIGSFNHSADIRGYLPVVDAYKDGGITTRIRSVHSTSYDIAGSKWSVGNVLDMSYYALNDKARASAQNFKAYLVPGIAYQATSKVNLSVEYEILANHKRDQNLVNLNHISNIGYLNATFTPTNRLSIKPYLGFRPGGKLGVGKIGWDSTTANLELVAKLL